MGGLALGGKPQVGVVVCAVVGGGESKRRTGEEVRGVVDCSGTGTGTGTGIGVGTCGGGVVIAGGLWCIFDCSCCCYVGTLLLLLFVCWWLWL